MEDNDLPFNPQSESFSKVVGIQDYMAGVKLFGEMQNCIQNKNTGCLLEARSNFSGLRIYHYEPQTLWFQSFIWLKSQNWISIFSGAFVHN